MTTDAPLVSVIVLNYQSADDTITAVEGLTALDWPRSSLEIIVVDNGSGDGSADRIASRFPDVTLVRIAENRGFAGGCNRGAEVATGEYLAFLNNDARPDPGWVRAAVDVLGRDGSVACVASKVLDWNGDRVDFVDAGLAFYGHGFKLHVGEPDDSARDVPRDVLFASGAAMVVRRNIFLSVGAFDERYFLFFEDVDLGWRLWLLGHRVRYVPESLVYHRHHATMDRFGEWYHQYLLERNSLFTIFKNYDDEHLRRALPAALALVARRSVVWGGDDPHALDIERAAPASEDGDLEGGADDERITVHKRTLAGLYAIDAFVEALPSLREDRLRLQATRVRGDHELTSLFRVPLLPNVDDPYFRSGFTDVVDALGIEEMFTTRRKIVVLTGDVLRRKMAGPAIRAWHIAQALAREHDVHLATTQDCDLTHAEFEISHVDRRDIARLERWADVIVFQGHLLRQYPALRRSRKVMVVDVYDPFHLETLEQARKFAPDGRALAVRVATDVLNEQLARGDFFLCASDKQRDFWLGQLAAVGRVNPLTYDRSESLAGLIDVVPFGIADDPPTEAAPVLKGVVPGIGPDDKVLLWGGGVYNWFDPLTLLRAVDKLRRRVPEVRLFFLGLQHPNPEVGEMRMAVETRKLADELGLTGSHVFFNEDWVEYDQRQGYLLESDIGVSTHLDHVETAYSFRTRVLDYLWASLPVVVTGGDAIGDVVDASGIGLTVPPGDVDALEHALFRLLDDEELRARCRANAAELAPRYRWANVLRPLVEFCRDPRRAADLLDPLVAGTIRSPMEGKVWPRRSRRADVRKAFAYLRAGNVQALAAKVKARLQGR